jgi:hypothetical protein
MLPGTRFVVSDILEKNATEMERNAALDLADYLIRFNYNQFRKQSIESEVEVSAVPEPPVLKDQEAPPIPVQITANENSEKQEDVKQSFFAGLNNSIYLQQPVKWDAEILSLESFFSSISLPQSSVSVSLGITIHDLPKFITGHLAILKTYNGNPVFLPYLKRLYLLQRIICSTED